MLFEQYAATAGAGLAAECQQHRGLHDLAIPELGIDAKIAPRSDKTLDILAAAPGEYAFYCDVCCGGKENPSMQGVLKVTA